MRCRSGPATPIRSSTSRSSRTCSWSSTAPRPARREQVGAVPGDRRRAWGGGALAWAERQEDRNRLWQARHDSFYAAKAMMPGKDAFATDVCVPISRLAECVVETQEDMAAQRHLRPDRRPCRRRQLPRPAVLRCRRRGGGETLRSLQRASRRPRARHGRHLDGRTRGGSRQAQVHGRRARAPASPSCAPSKPPSIPRASSTPARSCRPQVSAPSPLLERRPGTGRGVGWSLQRDSPTVDPSPTRGRGGWSETPDLPRGGSPIRAPAALRGHCRRQRRKPAMKACTFALSPLPRRRSPIFSPLGSSTMAAAMGAPSGKAAT